MTEIRVPVVCLRLLYAHLNKLPTLWAQEFRPSPKPLGVQSTKIQSMYSRVAVIRATSKNPTARRGNDGFLEPDSSTTAYVSHAEKSLCMCIYIHLCIYIYIHRFPYDTYMYPSSRLISIPCHPHVVGLSDPGAGPGSFFEEQRRQHGALRVQTADPRNPA